ncbi:MAG: tyrosine-protein phosphatase [Maricaulaceae bacterium]
MRDRLISLDGVHNFRDFGGWTAAEGAFVPRGRLLRSGQLSRATPDDQRAIAALGVTLVADLRRPSERQAEPSPWSAMGAPEVMVDELSGDGLAPHMRFLMEAELTPASTRAFMQETYARLPFEPSHQHLFSETLRRAADDHGPLLIHCAAGKDRTGVLAAVLLTVLGVSREAIYADYVFTNEAVDLDALLPALAERVSRRRGQTLDAEAVRPMMGVEAGYLDAAFAAIDAHHGGVEGYVEHALGLDADHRKRLRDALSAD